MINSNSKIGFFFSSSLEIDSRINNNVKEVNHVIELHNKLVNQVRIGKYTEQDFKVFRGVISLELIQNSEMILRLCDFFVENNDILYDELKKLCTKNILILSDTNRFKFIANGISNINSKLKSFANFYIDNLIKPTGQSKELLTEYLKVMDDLVNTDSDTYKDFIINYYNYINNTFENEEIKNLIIGSVDLEIVNLFSCLRFRINKVRNNIEHDKHIHTIENVAKAKNKQVLMKAKKDNFFVNK